MKQIPLEFKDWRDDRIEELEAKVTELEGLIEDLEGDYRNAQDTADVYYSALENIKYEVSNVIWNS